MNYCPGCQEPLETGQEKCPFCGYELIATRNEEEASESLLPDSAQKPFYKRAAFLVPLIIILLLSILGAGGATGYIYYQKKQEKDTEKNLKTVWIEVKNRSEQLSDSLNSVKYPSDLENFEGEITSFSEFLAEKQTEVINLEVTEKYEDNKETLLAGIEKYSKYIYLLKLILQKEAVQVKNEDYSKIRKISDDAEAATSKFVAEASFIDDGLSENVFKAINKIKTLIEKVKKEEDTKKKQKLKQQQSTEKKEAEKTVRSFEQARINQSGAEMRRYITPDYGKVFDPETEFGVTDAYLIDFKITKTEAKSEKVYEISGEEVGKDLTGEKFTNKWWFKVIKYEGDWLIDNRKLQNE